MSLLDWHHRRTDRWADQDIREALHWSFREACVGAGVALAVDGRIAGTMWRTPELTNIDLGPPVRLTVRMLPGQLPEQLARAGRRIAPHLGGIALRVTDRGHGWALVDVLVVDPLAGVVPRARPVASALHPLTLGRAEDGTDVPLYLAGAAHLIVQGSTGSGKSVGCYSLLGQLAAAPDVRVCGSDVSGLLLGPWARHHRHAGMQALGTGSPVAHVELLERLVAEMDRAIALIRPGRDAVHLGVDVPLTVVVVEELPGLLKLLDAIDPKAHKRARAAMARLLAEGRKAGFRVLLVTQRADAAIVGAYERSQASHRLSFRLDTADGLKMLHPDMGADLIAEHATAPPGVALLTAPGAPLTRLRAPLVDYGEYCATVGAAWPAAA